MPFQKLYSSNDWNAQKTAQPNQQNTSDYGEPGERAIAKTGLFDIPALGGILRGVEGGGEGFGRMALGAGFEGVRATASALGDKNAYATDEQGQQYHPNPFLSDEDLQKLGPQTAKDPATGKDTLVLPTEGLTRTAGGMGAAASIFDVLAPLMGAKSVLAGGVRNVVKTVGNAQKYATKGGISSLADKAAQEATDAGKYIHWDDLMEQAKNKVIKKFGDNAATREALSNVTSPRTPAGIESIPETLQQTPNQLLQLRRNLTNSYGKSLFQSATDKGIGALEQKVASEVRGTVAENLHRIAPGTVTPDKLYGLYSKVGGPAVKQLIKLIGLPAAGTILGYEAIKGLK